MTSEINAAAKRYRANSYGSTSFFVPQRTADMHLLADAMARQLTPIGVPTEKGWHWCRWKVAGGILRVAFVDAREIGQEWHRKCD
jgi:hypothetical protein